MRRLSTPGRARGALLAVALFVLLLGGGYVVAQRVLPDALGHEVDEQTLGAHSLTVGELVTIGFWPLGPRGNTPVRVTSARLTGMPEGIDLVSFHALPVPGRRIGVGSGDPTKDPSLDLHPLSDVRLVEEGVEKWYLLATVRITKPGSWTTSGLEVGWKAGWRRGTAQLPYHVRLSTTAEPR